MILEIVSISCLVCLTGSAVWGSYINSKQAKHFRQRLEHTSICPVRHFEAPPPLRFPFIPSKTQYICKCGMVVLSG